MACDRADDQARKCRLDATSAMRARGAYAIQASATAWFAMLRAILSLSAHEEKGHKA